MRAEEAQKRGWEPDPDWLPDQHAVAEAIAAGYPFMLERNPDFETDALVVTVVDPEGGRFSFPAALDFHPADGRTLGWTLMALASGVIRNELAAGGGS